MTLSKQTPFTKKVTDLPNTPSPVFSPTEIKEYFQTPSDELMETHNTLVDELVAPTGASEIGAKDGELDTTVQLALDKLKGDKATNERVETAENRITSAEARLTSVEDTASTALDNTEHLQTQYNEMVKTGDSSLEAAQARVDSTGKTYTTLKDRLDFSDAQLAEMSTKTYVDTELAKKATPSDITTAVTPKADKTYVDTQIQSVASGSPKGVYPTLSDLQTAFPTGNTNIYVVSADGNWYYWNGSAWVVGGVYQSTDINNKLSKVVLSNIVKNANFTAQTYWSATNATVNSVLNNELTFTPTIKLGQIRQNPLTTSVTGRIYYLGLMVKANSNLVSLDVRDSTGASLMSVNHSGSGQYEYLSVMAQINKNDTIQFRVMDSRDSGWDAITIKQAMFIDVTEKFGAGNEPLKSDLEEKMMLENGGSKFFESSLSTRYAYGYLPNFSPTKPFPLYVNVKNEVINIVSKYNSSEDLRIRMNKKGVNSLFDFAYMYKVANTTNTVSRDINGITAFNTNSSDWFAPYKVAAINTIDGNNPTSEHFTGGNHGYDNTGTTTGNTATGRTSSLKFVVDGREVTEFEGYCNFIDIYWSNRIQAYNTKKADGTGREVLQENYHLHYDGYKIEIRNTIEFLEAVTWKAYYGLQCQRTAWNEKLLYRSSANRKWNDGTLASNSTDKNCNIVTLKKGTDYLDLSVNDRVGLGRKDLLTVSTYNSYSTTSKTYFWLVDGDKAVEAGDIFTVEGYYRFYSQS